MQFVAICYHASSDTTYEEEVSFKSQLLKTPAEQAEAIRSMYRGVMPDVDVVIVKKMEVVDGAWY